MRVDAVGPDHPDVARDLNAIGALHHDAADMTAADTAYRRALEIFEKTLGADHYEVAMTCANLAVSTATAGDPVEARQLYERALPDAAIDLLSQADTALAATLPQDHPQRLDLLATVERLRRRDCGKA